MENSREADFIRRDFDKRVRNALAQGISAELGEFPKPCVREHVLRRDGTKWRNDSGEE